jgi:hypothetical protein
LENRQNPGMRYIVAHRVTGLDNSHRVPFVLRVSKKARVSIQEGLSLKPLGVQAESSDRTIAAWFQPRCLRSRRRNSFQALPCTKVERYLRVVGPCPAEVWKWSEDGHMASKSPKSFRCPIILVRKYRGGS